MKQIKRIVILSLFALTIALLPAGGVSAQNKQAHETLPATQAPIDCDPDGGADSYAGRGNNPRSHYYRHADYYRLRSNDTLLILPRFDTMQQTTEWSCGNVAVLVALRYLGLGGNETEWQLSVKMHSMIDRSNSTDTAALPGTARCVADYGTRLADMHRYLQGVDSLRIVSTSFRESYTESDVVKPGDLFPACDVGNLRPTFASVDTFASWLTEQLRALRPVLVEWSDWDGHWVCIIGIDTNGTPGFTGDDTLIFADPYDTSDHQQDGYTTAPLERFFYLWKDRAIAPKPYQLQPFIVLERR